MARVLGNVNAAGEITGGQGFTVSPAVGGSPGAWVIIYDQGFTATPTLLVSPTNAEWNVTYRNRSAHDRCEIETFANGTPSPASFDFLAIGDQ